jgi:hypothetical protein
MTTLLRGVKTITGENDSLVIFSELVRPLSHSYAPKVYDYCWQIKKEL